MAAHGVGSVREDAQVLILLPPSETKAAGGDAAATLDLAALPHADVLGATREQLVDALVQLSADPDIAMAALGLGERQRDELDRNAALRAAPTMPAVLRYTGVLYDALDVTSLRAPERRRAFERIAIGSALFGLVGAADLIPAYRLSAGSRLPQLGTLGAAWKPVLAPVLEQVAREQLVVDLRSGSYRALAPVRGAVTAQVLTEAPDGSRSVVSHFNKHAKGLLARALARTSSEPTTIRDVARIARRAGLEVEIVGDDRIDVITRTPTGMPAVAPA